jgi:hypothetical protein
MTALHCRRVKWMPDLNAIASALQMNAAPPGAPSNLLMHGTRPLRTA